MSEQGLPSTGRYVGPEEGTLKRLAIIAVMTVIASLLFIVPANAGKTTKIVWDIDDDGVPVAGAELFIPHVYTEWCTGDYRHKARLFAKLLSSDLASNAKIRDHKLQVRYASGVTEYKTKAERVTIDAGTGFQRLLTLTSTAPGPGKIIDIQGSGELAGAAWSTQDSWVLKYRVLDLCFYDPGGPQ